MFNYLAIPGSTNLRDIEIISELAAQVPPNGTIVEVGSWAGRSAVAWARNADPSVKIYCVDLFPDHTTYDSKNLKGFQNKIDHIERKRSLRQWDLFKLTTRPYPNIHPLRGKCPEEVAVNEPIDLLFLDAAHRNPIDWNIISHHLPYMKQNSILCGHDHFDRFPDVMENVQILRKQLNKEPELFEDSSMWIFRL